ncbi:uncharacterized protein EAE97_011831 [Botrytis byssoidea]|uniref:Uncharacterized protein n=1 Tax=Botrytis byssoidea TaxID=139641 RepID=A0A9P5HS56_9HELO|nr:uncharacterized protein EAE97_011831 [Botrytis byssoidea]KAF7918736.1 hypothetical protein EAE97_011831 [Botrytis byssoidea]
MPLKPFFPFNQDHPTFPAELRICQKDFSSRNAAKGATPILQDDRMNHSFIFEKECREAFSGFFRHGSKDFCFVENMNPNLLTEIFFEIKHSSNPSEYADITAAVRGIRDSSKFFFVSCGYQDPEYIIVRTYPKFRYFDWNDQSKIDNLNLFRMAAIAEGCGVVAFSGSGKILPPSEMRLMIEVTAEELRSKEPRVSTIIESSIDDMQDDTRVSNSSEAQSLQAHPSASKFQFRPDASPFQPAPSISQVNDRQSQFYPGTLERDHQFRPTAWSFQPAPSIFQVNDRQSQSFPGPLERARARRALGFRQGLQSLKEPEKHVQKLLVQSEHSHETLYQYNRRHVDNQGQSLGSGMQQQREKFTSPHYPQQNIVTRFQEQAFGMRQLSIHHGSGIFPAQELGTSPQQTRQTYGHMPRYATTQHYTLPQNQSYNLQQHHHHHHHHHHHQGFNQFRAQSDMMDKRYDQTSALQFKNQVCGIYQQYGQGQQTIERPQLHWPHAPRQFVQRDHNNSQSLVAPQQSAQQNSVPLQVERFWDPQQARQIRYQFENPTAVDFQQDEQDSNDSQVSKAQKVQPATEQNDLDPLSESKH